MTSYAKPRFLEAGDKIRFVSPASSPERERVEKAAELVRSWGFEADFAPHAFDSFHYFAGTDEERLADLNAAIRDPEVRAIFATRGGAGSYRIADGVDFAAARQDPKFLVGFSDITILQLAMWKHGIGGALHGALRQEDLDLSTERPSLRTLLTSVAPVTMQPADNEETAVLTTSGKAEGVLLGGNLDLLATAAGWMLPKLQGAILLLEATARGPGDVDRSLTMLRQAGHLEGVRAVAVGQFTEFKNLPLVLEVLRDQLGRLGIPILGGLPVGHRKRGWTVPLGRWTVLDADARTLTIAAD